MEHKLSSRLSRITESATLKMAAATRAVSAQGHSVINFTVGEPHFPIPQPVQEAAIKAIQSGFSKYTPVGGIPDLKDAIVKKLKSQNGLSYTADQILVSNGAKQSLCNFFLATVDEGDEVLIPNPYWTSYPEIVKLAGGTPVFIPTDEKTEFKFSAETLKKYITPKTKVLLLNSPSNPTGMIYSREEFTAIAKVLEGTSILVCSDEIYEHLLLGDKEFTSFAAVSPDAYARTLTINGFSKAYAMTGWRLGYAAGDKQIISAMQVIQGQSTSGANSVAQKAGVQALAIPLAQLEPQVEELRQRRSLMHRHFSDSPVLSYTLPDGAFYLFLNVQKNYGKTTPQGKNINNSLEMALYLLEVAHVGTVPGSGFGNDAYLRLSFALPEADINEGCTRIIRALKELR